MATRRQDRIFVRKPWQHYRRTYAVREAWISLGIVCVLGLIAAWIAWRGAHPDPELFGFGTELLDEGSEWSPDESRQLAPATAGAATAASTGPLPSGLAGEGWSMGKVSEFDAKTLYVKINGREGYYKSFGFERLYFVSLVRDGDETTVIDIEMYDQGNVANALGAYAGERQPDASPELSDNSISHLSQNAMFMVRGRYYIRAIGSDDSALVTAQLTHVRQALADGLEGEPLPWAFALFAGQLVLDAGAIAYTPENAFSFGFARDVYTVELTPDGAELFVTATESRDAATDLVSRFTKGFLSIGSESETADGVTWIEDQYLNTLAGVAAVESLVVGVRAAPDIATARQALTRLRAAAADMPESVRKRAFAEASARKPGGAAGYGEDPGDDPGGDSSGHDVEDPGDDPGEDSSGDQAEDPGAAGEPYSGEPGTPEPIEE